MRKTGGSGCGTSVHGGGTCGVGRDMCGVCRRVKLFLSLNFSCVKPSLKFLKFSSLKPSLKVLKFSSVPKFFSSAAKGGDVQREHNPVRECDGGSLPASALQGETF